MKNLKFLVLTLLLSPQLSLADGGQFFDRAIFVIFENTNYSKTMKQPFFRQLAEEGALLGDLYAIKHPSQPNYVAITSGSTQGVYGDGYVDLDVKNIVDLLEAKGVTWGVYAEDYPGECFNGKSRKGYVRRHNPFMLYLNIQKNLQRCSNIFNAEQFAIDADNEELPEYIFFVPNNRNNGHDTNVRYADQWYQKTFGPRIKDESFMADTVLITTFDEGSWFSRNQVYTSIYGPMVKAGKYNKRLSLYSLLALVEDNWDLGNLGKNDATAAKIPNIWLDQ